MPPPMPLSGTSRLNSAGSQSRLRQRLLEDGPDALAGIGGGRRDRSICSRTVATSVADERRVEHVLVGLERRQPVVVVQVAHDAEA